MVEERTIHDERPVKVVVRLRGLDCPDCAANLEKAVRGLPEVRSADLVYAKGELTVVTDHPADALPAVRRLAEQMGFDAEDEWAPAPAPGASRIGPWFRRNRQAITTATSGLLLLAAALVGWLGGPVLASRILYGLAIAVGGFYLARAGWTTLRTARTLDMNVLMVVAAVGAMFVDEYAEGAITIFLFSVGELLESYTSDRARNAIRSLMELAPPEATVERDGRVEVVPVGALVPGDRVLVRPGERLPVDGHVVEGASDVNQAPITGESIPVEKGIDSEVFAGTINGSGALTVEVTRVAEDTTIARILRMVSEAQSERAPAQRLVDRFAAVYTPIVLGLAVLIAALPPLVGLGAFDTWLYRALVLLVIACPCALVISTPVTIVSALTRAARSGVLVKGGRHLEALASVQVMAFDKTGTLTAGEPFVVSGACELHPDAPGVCENCVDLLAKAAALEGRSEHALARAVTRSAEDGVGLLVTVDCGIGAFDEVELASSLGLDVIITDHHEPGKSLPTCVAVVDPKRRDCAYPFEGLAGVGVAFKLASAVWDRYFRQVAEAEPLRYLDLVTLGTVADVVPLVDENRTIVSHGLSMMERTSNLGIRSLMAVSDLEGRALKAGHISFGLGPRINAAGRLGDPSLGARLFLTDSRRRPTPSPPCWTRRTAGARR